MEALSDGHTVSQLIKIAYLHAKRGAKTYMYHFSHTPTRKEGDHTQRAGSVHLEDLAYIFGYPLATKHSDTSHGYNKQDVSVSEAIITYYANFCKTGDPNNPGKISSSGTLASNNNKEHVVQKARNLVWQPYDTVTQQYLSFGMFKSEHVWDLGISICSVRCDES